jgi:hypothetical protein
MHSFWTPTNAMHYENVNCIYCEPVLRPRCAPPKLPLLRFGHLYYRPLAANIDYLQLHRCWR